MYEKDVQTLVDAGQLTEAAHLATTSAITALQMAALINQKLGLINQAIQLSRICTTLAPHDANLYGNLSYFLGQTMHIEEALAAITTAIELMPDAAEFHYNRAVLLSALMRIQEAIDCYHVVLKLAPDKHTARFHLGCMQMLNNDYQAGLANLEYRFKDDTELAQFRNRYDKPDWDGVSKGKLLVFSEQGMGDAIQYVRYLNMIDNYTIAEIQEELEPLLSQFFDVTIGRSREFNVLKKTGDLPDYDFVASISSLPHLLDPELKNIPTAPYLTAEPLYCCGKDTFNIGIVWAGSQGYCNDVNRSCLVKNFLPLKEPGVQLVSLQKGPMVRNWLGKEVNLADGIEELQLVEPVLNNFADTARYIRGLDLVISVDTAVAHLAGAMGVPVWLLLPFCHDHRWGMGQDSTPWYPSMRLFRQKAFDSWDDVFKEVARLL